MSKYIFIIIVFALSFSCAVKATSENKQIKDEVLESFKSLVDASKKLDSALYFQHFDSDKFVGLNADGTNWNSIDELTPLIISGFNAIEKVTHLKFNNVNISIIDNFTAILVNEYVQSMILKNGIEVNSIGGGTQVWSKRSGQWKIVSVSASNKPSASAP